ncbi:MAG: hypothetical protein AAGC68_12135, partial [Verrucomicrobiota bacterium]
MKRTAIGICLLALSAILGLSPLQSSVRFCTVSLDQCSFGSYEESEHESCGECEEELPCCLEIAEGDF